MIEFGLGCLAAIAIALPAAIVLGIMRFVEWRAQRREQAAREGVQQAASEALTKAEELTIKSFRNQIADATGAIQIVEVDQ